ncbi:hypothetical protein EDF67_103549 [Sphingobacterium sp. JUb78]|nr:hypothetical protein EDF67_103549 [Sphingobacterium sp. JUb78]
MKLNIKTILQSAMAVTVLSATVWATTPKTEQATAALPLTQTKANTNFTVIGQWWTPSDVANWPVIYLDLTTGNQSLSNGGQITLSRFVNATIRANAGFEIRTVMADMSAVSASDWSAANVVTSLEKNEWYEFDLSTISILPIQPITVMVGNSSGALYALTLNSFNDIQQKIVNGQIQMKTDLNIEYKVL